MSKFKVGDKVKIKENGEEGTVIITDIDPSYDEDYNVLVSTDLDLVPLGLTYDEYHRDVYWCMKELDLFDDEDLELVFRSSDDDVVNNPSHYTQGSIETIDSIDVITEAYEGRLSYYVGACVKYIARANFKGSMLEDLKKAQWYLNRAVKYLEKKMEGTENE